MTKGLFKARTTDKHIFKRQCNEIKMDKCQMGNHKIAIEIDKHKTINLKLKDNLKLFVSKFICNFSRL